MEKADSVELENLHANERPFPFCFLFSVLMGERREEDSWNFHYSMEVKDQVLFGSLDL